MPIDAHTLLWLFPIAFMAHDFEEIILGEPWLRRHGDDIKSRINDRVPAFLAEQMGMVLDKSAAELALPISLVFGLTVLSSFLATAYDDYRLLALWGTAFFGHAFAHLAQAVALQRYVPAIITLAVIVIPYGLILFSRLISEGITDLRVLCVNLLLGGVLGVPFILITHKVGDYLFKRAVRLLIG